MEPAAIERPLLSTLWALPVPQHSSACRGLGSCAGSGQGKGHGGEGEGQHKHRQERRLQLALPWEALLCSTLRTRSGVGFWGGFRLSRPLPTHWFFPWTSRALEKRNESPAVLSVGFRSRLVSLCLGFSEHWDIQSLSESLPGPLTSCCAGCARQGWVDPCGGRNHGEFRGNAPSKPAAEVAGYQGTVPVAQSPPSTGRGHSHGAGPALALQMGAALWMGLSEGTLTSSPRGKVRRDLSVPAQDQELSFSLNLTWSLTPQYPGMFPAMRHHHSSFLRDSGRSMSPGAVVQCGAVPEWMGQL